MGANKTESREWHKMKVENSTQAGPTEPYNLEHSLLKLYKKACESFNR